MLHSAQSEETKTAALTGRAAVFAIFAIHCGAQASVAVNIMPLMLAAIRIGRIIEVRLRMMCSIVEALSGHSPSSSAPAGWGSQELFEQLGRYAF
jgi:hypothetical protein